MDVSKLQEFIERSWEVDVMPPLIEYIAIPCESPAFDPDWAANGHMDRAVDLLTRWAQAKLGCVPGATVDVIRLPERTPLIFIDIPGDLRAPVLIYGHLDKQPPMSGWETGRGAWTPVLEGDRLYGRGGADDGYSLFSAVTAVLALREQGLDQSRCMMLIEACEESSSTDLPYYVEYLAPRMGIPAVIIALDAGCGNYDQLWMTTSLRGQVAGTLSVRVLKEGVHSGDAAGMVPSSFRIARQLLSRLENPDTGEIVVPEFHVPIPEERRAQAASAAAALGTNLHAFPFPKGMAPVTGDLTELALNRSWRPQLVITGIDGLPGVANAAAVMQPLTALKLSLRLPPTLDPEAAGRHVKALLEANPPYGCDVSFAIDFASRGWHVPAVAPWLSTSLDEASRQAFGSPSALIGGGGGIPFLAMLGERFPQAQFVVTGVLGPQSNAHGPNEFLHVPTAKRITAVVAYVLHDAFRSAAIGEANSIQSLGPTPLQLQPSPFNAPGAHMKLLYQTHSPYARKTLVFAHEIGIADRIEIVHHETSPTSRNEHVFVENPLGKVPVLVRPGLSPIFDSDVICAYFDTLHDRRKLIPPDGEARWQALRMQAVAQGLADAGIAIRWETIRRPEALRYAPLRDGYIEKLIASYDWLEQALDVTSPTHVGHIAVATALSWLEFRDLPTFRENRPRLVAWFDEFEVRPSMRATPLSGETHD